MVKGFGDGQFSTDCSDRLIMAARGLLQGNRHDKAVTQEPVAGNFERTFNAIAAAKRVNQLKQPFTDRMPLNLSASIFRTSGGASTNTN